MGTIKAILVLVFAILLASNIAYAGPIQGIAQGTTAKASLPSAGTIAAMGNLIQIGNFIKTYTDYLDNTPSGKSRMVAFTAISNQPDGTATYCSALMNYNKNAGTLTGDGAQYFSNRQWNFPATGNAISVPQYPFDPKKTDKLRLTLDTNGGATLTLLSQGNTQETIGLQLSNNVLYGFTSTSPAAMFVISLQESQVDIPK